MDGYQPGQELGPPRKEPEPFKEMLYVMKAALWSTSAISYLVLLVLSVAFLFALTPDIQNWISTPLPNGVMHEEVLFIIFPLPMKFAELDGMAFQAWHIVVLGIFALCFFYGLYRMLGPMLENRKAAEDSLVNPDRAGTGIQTVAKLFFAVTFFSFLYFVFLEGGGVSPDTPAFDQMSTNELLYRLFSASVWEEIVSRSLLIGFPLMLFAAALKWDRPYTKFLLGGGMRLNTLTIWLIIISSVVFALAHVGSWDFWKVPQVLVSGMALGFAFVRFGLYASVLLHFSINFVTSWVYEFASGNEAVEVLLGMVVLLWIIAGSYFFIDFTLKFGKKLLGIDRTARKVPEENRHIPVESRTPGGFVCPHCGNYSARYGNGVLTCLRCNRPYSDEEKIENDKIDLEKQL
ncbi:MAG: hypothetical protein AYK23_03315 [Candidatus Proteinoplasmatales archaeon SG8-5]|nr:MAG: hypothetical protein AYK23_03315 [Candidatus Proteinoplasmatales archaeon SG8-5]